MSSIRACSRRRLPGFANTRSVRVAGGLGTVARVVGNSQEIYARKLQASMRCSPGSRRFTSRIIARSRALLSRAWQTFGTAVLIDCHSMPSVSTCPPGRESERRVKADFVLGDRYGTSCAADLIDLVDHELRRMGYTILRNKPYAGGFITEHYGDPVNNIPRDADRDKSRALHE